MIMKDAEMIKQKQKELTQESKQSEEAIKKEVEQQKKTVNIQVNLIQYYVKSGIRRNDKIVILWLKVSFKSLT